MQSVNTIVAALNTTGFFWFVDVSLTEPDPSLGEDGQYAYQPTTGKQWVKAGGVWTYLGIYKGLSFRGAYDNSATYSVGDVQTTSGTSYVWINATPGSGHPAPDTTYWQVLAAQGIQGPTGATGSGYGGTSTTSLAIGTGPKPFPTQAGLAYQNGARVRASSAANTSNWMEGLATYAGTTLTITVDKTNGSGTFADWNFNVVGQPGAGDLSSANNLADLANKDTALSNLGGTTTGKAVFKSASADAALDTLGVVDRVIDQGNIPQMANFDITLPSGYDEIEIGLFGFGCSVSGAGLNLQVSTDGTTFLSSSYSYAGHYITTADTTYHGYSAAGTGSNIPLSNLFPAGRLAQLKIRLARPDGTSGNKLIRANMDQVGTDLQPVQLNVMGGYLGGTAALQKLRLIWNGGTSPAFAAGGTYIVRGVKKKP